MLNHLKQYFLRRRGAHAEGNYSGSDDAVIPISQAFLSTQLTQGESDHEPSSRASYEASERGVMSPSPTVELELRQGEVFAAQQNWAKSMHHYRRAVELAPMLAIAHQKLAESLEQNGQLNEAVVHYRHAIQLNTRLESYNGNGTGIVQAPASEPLSAGAEEQVNQAAELCQQHQWDEAIALCETLYKHYPASATVHKIWGTALQGRGETQQAMERYQQAIQLQPTYAEVYANLGNLHAQQHQWDSAIQHYQRAIALKPGFAGAYRNLAKVWSKLDKPRLAAECWYQALILEPDHATPAQYLTVGNELMQHGQLQQAIACYRRVVELDETFPGGLLNLAEALSQHGLWQEATTCYRKAMRLHGAYQNGKHGMMPASNGGTSQSESMASQANAESSVRPASTPYSHHIQQYAQDQQWEQVLAIVEQGLQHLEPEAATLYQHQGKALRAQGKVDAAIQCYRKLATLQPDSAETFANLGSLYAQQQQWQRAIASYQRAIAIHPNFAGVHRNLARVWTQTGHADAAAESWYRALSLEPSWATAEEHFSLGNTLVAQGRSEWAVTCYQQALSQNPRFTDAYHQLATILEQQNDLSAAEACYQAAIHHNSDDTESYFQLGRILSSQKHRWKDAVRYYQQVVSLDPQHLTAHLNLGHLLTRQGEWYAATICLQKVADLQPDQWDAHHNLGDILLKQQRWEEAVQAYHRAIALNPTISWSYNNLGDALLQLEKWSDAATAFRQAIALHPEFHWSHYNLGEALAKLSDWDGAIAAYQKALELQPETSLARRKLADALRLRCQRDSQAALDYYRQAMQADPSDSQSYHGALDLDPNNADLYVGLAHSLRQKRDLEGAIVFYQLAHQLNPDDSKIIGWIDEVRAEQTGSVSSSVSHDVKKDSKSQSSTPLSLMHTNAQPFKLAQADFKQADDYITLGKTLHRQGRIQEAMQVYRQGLETFPDSPGLLHHLGAAYADLQHWQQAIALYRKTLEMTDTSPVVHHHLGKALAKLKDWEGAICAYERAIAINPHHANYYCNLGFARMKKGDCDQAISAFRKAVELRPQHYSLAYRPLQQLLAQKAQLEAEQLRNQSLTFSQTDFEGCLDGVTKHGVFGWARHKTDSDKVVFVDIFVGNNLIGTFPANKFRQDLADAFQTHGCHKFEAKLPPSITSDGPVEVSAKISENGQSLKKSPATVILGTRGKKHSAEGGNLIAANQLVYRKPRLPSRPPQLENPLVAIIILNLNGANLIKELFNSFVIYNSYEPIEFIVIDHGSTDDSVSVCNQWSETLPITVIARGKNYSFSASNNYAASQTDAPLLLFMNNDLTLCQDIIPELVELTHDRNVGIIGAKLFDIVSERSLAHPPIQHLGVQFDFYSQNEPWYPFEVRYAPQMLGLQSMSWRVPVVTGALMMCRHDDFRAVGGFNEAYFYGYEDVDLCLSFQRVLSKDIISANYLSAFHHRGYSRFSGKLSDAFMKRVLNNRNVIEQRYGYYVRRQHLNDFFEKGMYWTSHPLRVGFVVTDASLSTAAGDYFTAAELGEKLVREFGWEVFYLSEGEEWYDLTALDVVVVMRHEYDVRLIENAKPGLVKVAWVRNWFEVWGTSASASNYDCFWSSSRRGVEYLENQVSQPVLLLPIATQSDRFSNAQPRDAYQSDYCFTGSFWNSPREIMDLLNPENLSFDFALYGYNWEKVDKFKPYYRGALPYSELPSVYASTKIVIDDANLVTKDWGSVNSRVFDAIATGALVITNGKLGSDEVFAGLLPTYDSQESLEQLLTEYLTDDVKRQSRVAELQQIVLEHHTYRHRAHTVFAALKNKMSQTFRVSIKIGVPRWEVADEWGDYHFAIALKRALERHGHSVRIDILPEWETSHSYGDDIAITLRGLSHYQPKPYHINIMWNISHPDKVTLDEYEQFDHVFVASDRYAIDLQEKVSVPVQSLLQCTDPSVFYPDFEASDVDGSGACGNVLFVGNSRKVYRKIVRDAVESGLEMQVYGTNWEEFLPPHYLKGQYIPNQQLRRYYTNCGVLLNDHWDTMRQMGFLSNRLFDAAACGAVIVSDSIPGLDAVFGTHVITYQEAQELPERVQMGLNQREQTRGDRLAFAEHIRRYHSFDQRARDILTVIQSLHEEKMNHLSIV
ncbi:MAG: tetratricopeptide repeat protein [Elainellaceae cyanobacterium]